MAEATRRRAAGGLVVVCAAQFVVGVDGLAVAVALPTLQRDLELTTGQVQWVLTAFGLGSGGLLGSAAVMLLVYALTRLEAPGRGLVSAALPGGAGLVLLAGFVAWERRAPAPLLRPGILSIRSLRGATLGAAANSGGFTAVVFVGTLYLQTGLGYPPLRAGLAVLPLDLVAAVVGFTAGRLLAAARRGRRPWPPSWPAPPPWAGWPGLRSRPATPPTCCRPCWCSASRRRSAS